MCQTSLPSRERGLKLPVTVYYKNVIESLPSRERGLKLMAESGGGFRTASLPSRERGLKSDTIALNAFVIRRSPRGSVD